MTITLPYNYTPRSYQFPILKALDSRCNRIVWVAHRRSGKDKTCINIVAKKNDGKSWDVLLYIPDV